MRIQGCSRWLLALFASVSVLTSGCDGVEDTAELEAVEDDADADGAEVARVGVDGPGDLKSPEAPSFAGTWCCDSCDQTPDGSIGCTGCTPSPSTAFCTDDQTFVACAGDHVDQDGRVTCHF